MVRGGRPNPPFPGYEPESVCFFNLILIVCPSLMQEVRPEEMSFIGIGSWFGGVTMSVSCLLVHGSACEHNFEGAEAPTAPLFLHL